MFKLLGPHLLIKMIEEKDSGEFKTKGGIILQNAGKRKDDIQRGKVIQVSEETFQHEKNKFWNFEVGQTIILPKQCYLMQITIDNEIYHTVRCEEVVGIEPSPLDI